MKWYKDNNERYTFNFDNLATITIPYTGLGIKFRLRVKYALAICMMLAMINTILLAFGNMNKAVVFGFYALTGICLWVLFKTRTKTYNEWVKTTILYNNDNFGIYYKALYNGYTNGIQSGKEVLYTIKYRDIEGIKLYNNNSSIEIIGTIRVEVRNQSSLMEDFLDIHTEEQLILMPKQEYFKKIIDDICKNSEMDESSIVNCR